MLPKMDGFDVCSELAQGRASTAPIILLTARTQEAEKELGLDSGADDYVTKPFSLRELRARIRAQLRRAGDAARALVPFGECEVDFDRAELRRSGQRVEITPQELRLLDVFVRNRGRVLSREQLIDAAWGRGVAITDRAVDTQSSTCARRSSRCPPNPGSCSACAASAIASTSSRGPRETNAKMTELDRRLTGNCSAV